MPKVILYIAMSQDGFIADKDGGVDWLPHPDDGDTQEFGYEDLMGRISTIIMGSRSYQQILGFGNWAWSDKHTYVFTSGNLTTDLACVSFVKAGPKVFIKNLDVDQDIWLLGGAQLAGSFAKEGLIDELIITIIPVNLGEGIKLELPWDDFDFSNKKLCSKNIIQKVYQRKKT
jgi:dihydrofolate reductase